LNINTVCTFLKALILVAKHVFLTEHIMIYRSSYLAWRYPLVFELLNSLSLKTYRHVQHSSYTGSKQIKQSTET